jgi:hypothetical protein
MDNSGTLNAEKRLLVEGEELSHWPAQGVSKTKSVEHGRIVTRQAGEYDSVMDDVGNNLSRDNLRNRNRFQADAMKTRNRRYRLGGAIEDRVRSSPGFGIVLAGGGEKMNASSQTDNRLHTPK